MLRTLTIGSVALAFAAGSALAQSGTTTESELTDTQPDVVYEIELPENAVIGIECADGIAYKASATAGQPGTALINDVYYIPCDNIEGREDVSKPEEGTAADAGTNENDQ